MRSFARGVALLDNKENTADSHLVEAKIPKTVILPLQQHLGCPTEPLVKIGDEVFEGQKIADSDKFVSAPIHSSISGRVVKIDRLPNVCGFNVDSIVIEAGGQKEPIFAGKWKIDEFDSKDIRRIVREAGVVGLGGAAFPTHVKLTPPSDKIINTLIINGCECEPYITADQRLMMERPGDILFGAKVIAKAAGAGKIIVAVEENKKECIQKIKAEISARRCLAEVVVCKTKYPQGGEKMLIRAALGIEVPSGGLPHDVGVLVSNVATAVAVGEAVEFGKPLTKRAITVAGSGVRKPQNLIVRIGTPFADVIEQCGGIVDGAAKIIMGGPMMGIAFSSLQMPVVKATTCLLVLGAKEAREYEEKPCIRCGRCIKACPVGLMPNFLNDFSRLKKWEKLEEYHMADCIECGCCSYVCPSRIYLVQSFKLAKQALQSRKNLCR